MATTQFLFFNKTSQKIYLLHRLDNKKLKILRRLGKHLLVRKTRQKTNIIRTAKNKICKEGFIRQKTFLEKRDIKSIFQEDKTNKPYTVCYRRLGKATFRSGLNILFLFSKWAVGPLLWPLMFWKSAIRHPKLIRPWVGSLL